MSGLVGYAGLYLDGAVHAARIRAADGREVVLTKQEIQDWVQNTVPRPTLAEGGAWAGQAITSRWNALAGVRALVFTVHVFVLNPLDVSLLVTAPGVAINAQWWARPALP